MTRICALCQGPELEAGGQKGCGTWLTNSFKCFHCCHYKFARVATAPATAPCAVCKSQHFVNLIAALCKLSGRHRGRRRKAEEAGAEDTARTTWSPTRGVVIVCVSLSASLYLSLFLCVCQLPVPCGSNKCSPSYLFLPKCGPELRPFLIENYVRHYVPPACLGNQLSLLCSMFWPIWPIEIEAESCSNSSAFSLAIFLAFSLAFPAYFPWHFPSHLHSD